MATAAELRKAIEKRFRPPEWIIAHEVRNATGYQRGTPRYADVLALSLWPSRGVRLVGIEIKISRADFARELVRPEKADAIQPYCDEWFVCAPARLLDATLLPPTWGLLELQGQRLLCRPAVKALKPRPWSRDFVASLVRNVHDAVATPRAELAAAERDRLFQEGRAMADKRISELEEAAQQAGQVLRAFQMGTGVSRWADADEVTRDLRRARAMLEKLDHRTDLRAFAKRLVEVADELDQALPAGDRT